ncbi:MAG TPA: cupin domain-containing protein [Acidimicrobiia bacterium]|nr:cupin domain-containing protein [Acidimicrobiia bacterium]
MTTVPHVDLAAALARSEPGADGAVWSIETGDLDANLVRLGPGGAVSTHRNDEVDVLVVGIDGAGTLTVDDTDVTVARDVLACIPRGTTRAIRAHDDGLAYVTVHRRRAGLTIRGSAGTARR